MKVSGGNEKPDGELTQGVPCPRCGWERSVLESAQGLSSTERRCLRGSCRCDFVVVWRQDELVGTAPLSGHDIGDYRNALHQIDGLSDVDVGLLVGQARQRSRRTPFQHGARSA